MCYFITAALPAGANIEKVSVAAKKYNLAWLKAENSSVNRQLDSGSSYFLTTTGECDCDTLLGSANKIAKTQNTDNASKISALRKKGWSETKINRWLSEKSDLNEQIQINNRNPLDLSELDTWIEFISEILNSKLSDKVSVLLHMYSTSVSTESIHLSGKFITTLKDLNKQTLLNMQEDHIYEFVKT